MHHFKWLSCQKICPRSKKTNHRSGWLCNGGIEFENITKLEADVVILATGLMEREKSARSTG